MEASRKIHRDPRDRGRRPSNLRGSGSFNPPSEPRSRARSPTAQPNVQPNVHPSIRPNVRPNMSTFGTFGAATIPTVRKSSAIKRRLDGPNDMAAGFSARLKQTSHEEEKMKAIRHLVIHHLAIMPMTVKLLQNRIYGIREPTGDRLFMEVLKQVADFKAPEQLFHLKTTIYPELDVHKFNYRSEVELAAAIKNTQKHFGILRLDLDGPEWRRLAKKAPITSATTPPTKKLAGGQSPGKVIYEQVSKTNTPQLIPPTTFRISC